MRRISAFLVLLVSFTTVYSSVAFYLLSSPASQNFLTFGVFSDKGTLADFLPGSGLAVTGNQTIRWELRVGNRMGSVEFVRIVFRVSNLTSQSPSDTAPAASLGILGVVDRFIPDGMDENVGFEWELESVKFVNGLFVPVLRIGDETPIVSPVGTSTGRDFRFVFELWTFDKASDDFRYGWSVGGVSFANWLQVWFDVVG